MSSQWNGLIGQKLSDAKCYLQSLSIVYDVHYTRGRKDQELLSEDYVIRALGSKDSVELLCCGFKTTIE